MGDSKALLGMLFLWFFIVFMIAMAGIGTCASADFSKYKLPDKALVIEIDSVILFFQISVATITSLFLNCSGLIWVGVLVTIPLAITILYILVKTIRGGG